MKRGSPFHILSLSLLLALNTGCVRVDGLKVYVDDGDPITQESALKAESELLKIESFEQSIDRGYQACGLVKEKMDLTQAQVISSLNPVIGKVFVEESETGEYIFWRFTLGPVLAVQGISNVKVEKLISNSSDFTVANNQGNWATVAGDRTMINSGKNYSVSRIGVTRSLENRHLITWIEKDQSGNEYCQYLAVDVDDDSHLLVSDLTSVSYLPRKAKKTLDFLRSETWKDLWQQK